MTISLIAASCVARKATASTPAGACTVVQVARPQMPEVDQPRAWCVT